MILAGGGTGGHIYPALAVAESLRRSDDEHELLYIGVSGRMDERIVGKAGLTFSSVSAGQLRVRSPLAMLRGVWQLIRGTLQAWRLLGRFGPDAVFATSWLLAIVGLGLVYFVAEHVHPESQDARYGAGRSLLRGLR